MKPTALIPLLPTALAGCFMHTAEPVIDQVAQDVPDLAGIYADEPGLDYRISRIGTGLYRLRTPETPVDPEAWAEIRMFAGDCEDIEDPQLAADCERPTAEICAEESRDKERRDCELMLGALRGELDPDALPVREAAIARSLTALSGEEPHRDDIVFAAAALPEHPDWFAAQALMIASHGELSDFGIFQPQIVPLDIVLLQRTETGWIAYPTFGCPGARDEDPIEADDALGVASACVDQLAADETGRRVVLTRAGPP